MKLLANIKIICSHTALVFGLATSLTSFSQTVEYKWVEQKEKTGDYNFSFRYSTDGDNVESAILLRVSSNTTNKVIQEIPNIEIYPAGIPDDERLSVIDANFDGYPDISIYAMSGGAGPNDTSYFYIYNPKTKKFEIDKKLSSLTAVSIDAKNKSIYSSYRASCCDHADETYRYISGKLTLVKSWHEYSIENGVVTETGKLINGKMKYSKRIEKF